MHYIFNFFSQEIEKKNKMAFWSYLWGTGKDKTEKMSKGEPGITNSTEDKIECNVPVQMERKNNKDLQSEIKDDSAIKAYKNSELLSGIYSDLHLALLKSYQLKTDIDLVSSTVYRWKNVLH